ncbi:hypothetical protein E2562_018150 [Oryza meyeriana var. granulata]|uniref:Uncharacterized protein n=1 Tax=Oryza meyeriana var. granulata TaxID=110450 RepID=A0A6G1C6C4_9ORYZ|nr:hypothetical protein E2562_018150 [Oryza meyeriana var. granulata]
MQESTPVAATAEDEVRTPAPTPAPITAVTSSPAMASPTQFVSPSLGISDMLDADHDNDAPLQFHAINNLLSLAAVPGFAAHEMESRELFLTSANELSSFKEAEQDVLWHKTMAEELKSIQENKT